MHVIQLTSVPPPTPVPARVMIDASHDTLKPWLRYSRSNAPSSSAGISGSGTNAPASSTTTDRPACDRSAASDAATRARADDDDVRLEHERLARGRPAGDRPEVERPDRRRVGGHRLRHDVEADRREARVDARLARIGVGEEREQALEPLVGRPALRDARRRPREQVRLASRLVEVREADRASGEQQVRGARLERDEHELELADLGGIGGEIERGGGQASPSLGIAADDRLADGGERRERPGRPALGVRSRRTRHDGCRRNGSRGGGHLRRDHNDTQPLLVPVPDARPASGTWCMPGRSRTPSG